MNFDLAKLKKIVEPEKSFNIWTLRLTPIPHEKIDDEVEGLFRNLSQTKFPRIILYKEKGKRLHYHARVCATTWATRKSIHDLITSAFPGQSGNTLFSTKKVFVRGKEYSSLTKSVTYIAKETDVIYTRGYKDEEIYLFEKIGSEWREIANESLHLKIIRTYNIDCTKSGSSVVNNILEYYEQNKKDIPTNQQLCKLLHNIKYKVSAQYRKHYHDRASSFYDNLDHAPIY